MVKRDVLIRDETIFAAATADEALFAAWARVHANGGAAGGDGVTVERFRLKAAGAIPALGKALRSGTYAPGPVRTTSIPKRSGGLRPLSIPSVVDRIAQTAVHAALAPALDAEFEESSFAYRAGRSVQQAVRRVQALRGTGRVFVVDADIERYFETVAHDRLLARLARSMTEGPTTDLVALWLEHGGVDGRGLPQGSPLSPLLANLFLDDLDEAFGEDARIVRYADDFVILTRTERGAEAAAERARALLGEIGLSLNTEKTRVVDFEEGFRFLGHLFVRSLALPSPEPDADEGTTDAEALLRLVADRDRSETARETAARAADDLARATGREKDFRLLHLMTPGRRLSVDGPAFVVEEPVPGPAGPTFRDVIAVPYAELDRIDVGPKAHVTEEAVRHALATATPLAFVDGHGETLGWVAPATAPRARRHLAQARHALDPALRLALARAFVAGRAENQRAQLRRMNREAKNAEVAAALVKLNREIRRIPHVRDLDHLRGVEGFCTQLFWPSFGRLLPPAFTFSIRKRSRGADMVNILLDFASALLSRDVSVAIAKAGLHPGFAYLHESEDGRDSLVFDLMEEFRTPLMEAVVAGLVAGSGIGRDDFEPVDADRLKLKRSGAEALIRAYERAAERVVAHPVSGKRRAWRGIVVEQAFALAAHVEGRGTYTPVTMDY